MKAVPPAGKTLWVVTFLLLPSLSGLFAGDCVDPGDPPFDGDFLDRIATSTEFAQVTVRGGPGVVARAGKYTAPAREDDAFQQEKVTASKILESAEATAATALVSSASAAAHREKPGTATWPGDGSSACSAASAVASVSVGSRQDRPVVVRISR